MDKSKWIDGPWMHEPDDEIGEYRGLVYRLRRHDNFGNWCGYVRVPTGHPLYGLGYSNPLPEELLPAFQTVLEGPAGKRSAIALFCMDKEAPCVQDLIDVHGGLTYAGPMGNLEGWWFGFDCGHAGDLSPGTYSQVLEMGIKNYPRGTYRDIEYVRAECQRLADQLLALDA